MGAALVVRDDLEAADLRRLARRERDGRVAARLLAIAGVLDGMSRAAAARAAGMDRQTLRDWVIRFNAEGIAGLHDQPRPGRPARMDEGRAGGAQGDDPAWTRSGARRGLVLAHRRSVPPGRRAPGRELPPGRDAAAGQVASTCHGRRPGHVTRRPAGRRRSGSKRRYGSCQTHPPQVGSLHRRSDPMASVLSQAFFHDETAAYTKLESIVWPNGAVCPHCGCTDRMKRMGGTATRPGLYKCYACRKQSRVTVGTVFESSHVKLHQWLQAAYLMCSSKKGISSNQLARTLGVTVKTGWFMSHRLREAMTAGTLPPLGGEGAVVENR